MSAEVFFNKVRSYYNISEHAELVWRNLLRERKYKKGENIIAIGQIPKKVAFVVTGLLSQYYITDKGDTVIKYFFPEGRIAGSIPATLTQCESVFSIEALEDSVVLEYDFREFKKIVSINLDVAEFYIRYLEKHWVIDKEPLEIVLRTDTAAKRYDDFLKKYPNIIKRLKKHQIASYLGVTPTQLSRIFLINK